MKGEIVTLHYSFCKNVRCGPTYVYWLKCGLYKILYICVLHQLPISPHCFQTTRYSKFKKKNRKCIITSPKSVL
jgi:hypothetical protein